MKCPICQKEMDNYSDSVTNNGKNGDDYKEYRRKVYHCPGHDVWISVETPLVSTQSIA